MPKTPSSSAITAAMPSITSVNDVRAIDMVVQVRERAHLRQRKIRIHRPHGLPDFAEKRFRVAPIAADDEADTARQEVASAECLRVQTGGQEHRRRRRQMNALVMEIARDADDLAPYSRIAFADPLPDGGWR